MRRKRRPPPKVHSISCTDAEWERARVLAERRGMSISRYFVECGLNVDPTTETPAPPRLVLDEVEQRRLHDSLVRIAERTAEAGSEEEVLTRIRNALALLVEARMREMVRDGPRVRAESAADGPVRRARGGSDRRASQRAHEYGRPGPAVTECQPGAPGYSSSPPISRVFAFRRACSWCSCFCWSSFC